MKLKGNENNLYNHKFVYTEYNINKYYYNRLYRISKNSSKDFKKNYINFNNYKNKKDDDDSGSTNIFKFFENFRKLFNRAKIHNLILKNLLKVDKREVPEVKTYSKLEELLTILIKIFKKNKLTYANIKLNKSEQLVGKNSNVNIIKIPNLSNSGNKIISNLIIIGGNIKRKINNIFSFDNIKKEYIKPFIEITKNKINEFEQMFKTIKSEAKSIIFELINASMDVIINIINENIKIIDFGEINNNNCKNIKPNNEFNKSTEIIDNSTKIICNNRNYKNDDKNNSVQLPDNFNSYNPPICNNGNDNGDKNGKKDYRPNNPLDIIPPAPAILPTINNGDNGINNSNYIDGKGYYNENNNNDLFDIIVETDNMINNSTDQLSDMLNNLKEVNDNYNFDEINDEIDCNDWGSFDLIKSEEFKNNHYYKRNITNDLEELNNELNDYILSQDKTTINPLNP